MTEMPIISWICAIQSDGGVWVAPDNLQESFRLHDVCGCNLSPCCLAFEGARAPHVHHVRYPNNFSAPGTQITSPGNGLPLKPHKKERNHLKEL